MFFFILPRVLGRRLARKLAIPPNACGRLIWIYADWGIGVALYLLYRGLWCASTPRPCYTIYNRYKLSIYTPISAYIITEGIDFSSVQETVTDVKPLQYMKAECPIVVTELGIVIDVKPVQP